MFLVLFVFCCFRFRQFRNGERQLLLWLLIISWCETITVHVYSQHNINFLFQNVFQHLESSKFGISSDSLKMHFLTNSFHKTW